MTLRFFKARRVSRAPVDEFPANPTAVWPPRSKDRKGRTHYEIASEFHRRNAAALATTGMTDNPLRRQRYFTLEQLAEQVRHVEGDACEVGCYRGASAYLIAGAFARTGKKLTFHICDSFEGLSELKSEDLGPSGETLRGATAKNFVCSESTVRNNLKEFPFLEFHKGWIPEPFAALTGSSFCFVHIDVDLYEPTKASIEFFWPRLSTHGVLVLDDHGTTLFPGARRAATEFFATRRDGFFVEFPSGEAFAMKVA